MIKSVLNKIANNIWLFLCLTLGSLLITAILASVPIYSNGSLQKMLSVEQTQYEESNGVSAGQTYVRVRFGEEYSAKAFLESYQEIQSKIDDGIRSMDLQYNSSFTRLAIEGLFSNSGLLADGKAFVLDSWSGLEDHVKLLSGRFYSDQVSEDGILEVMVTQEFFDNYHLSLDTVYPLVTKVLSRTEVFVKVVGVFEPKTDPSYWYMPERNFQQAFLVHSDAFSSHFVNLQEAGAVTLAAWYYDLDFMKMSITNLGPFIRFQKNLSEYLKDTYGTGRGIFRLPFMPTMNTYLSKGFSLKLTLWLLNVPLLAMLLFYTLMVTRMIIEEDRNEIAALRSRGARPKQIFGRYAFESLFIVGGSMLIGPPVGLLLAKFLGSSDGFLEFANRSNVEAHLSLDAYLFALAAGAAFLLMVLLPAYFATKTTIVQHKQKKARKKKKPFWEKTFLDIILLGLSCLLLYLYKRIGAIDVGSSMDPIVYILSTVFILSCGLVFLRLYPLLVKLFFFLLRRILPPTGYATFVQVSRNGSDSRFLMLFLIMTLAIGVYSSSAARIINHNVEQTALYESGTDFILTPTWEKSGVYDDDGQLVGEVSTPPSLDAYRQLNSVEHVTQVFNQTNVQIENADTGRWAEKAVRLMAIQPYDFAKTAWLHGSYNQFHWYNYINVMQEYPNAVLLSSGIAKDAKVEVGDSIFININMVGASGENYVVPFLAYVIAVVDYWPNFYNGAVLGDNSGELLVMNYNYLSVFRENLPYDLWVKKAADTSDEQFLLELRQAGLEEEIVSISSRSDMLAAKKSDSLLRALNGSFSLEFVATLVISLLGFLIYWIMSVRKRKLQFSVLRAMGLTKFKLSLMLFWEHLMTTGVSVAYGFVVGALTMRFFLPLLQITYAENTLPLLLVFETKDNLRILATIAVMLIVGIAVLTAYINKLKINEAIKIGEE